MLAFEVGERQFGAVDFDENNAAAHRGIGAVVSDDQAGESRG